VISDLPPLTIVPSLHALGNSSFFSLRVLIRSLCYMCIWICCTWTKWFDNLGVGFTTVPSFSQPIYYLTRFPRLTSVTCIRFEFRLAHWLRLDWLVRVITVALADNTQLKNTICPFSRPWHQLQVFPRLALVPRFPALDTSSKFSHVWHWFRGFPPLTPAPSFPALGNVLHVFAGWLTASFASVVPEQRW